MIIKPSDKSLKSLLEGGFYKIPRFQRPYSWDQENVDDFWSDAIASDDPDYFIGSFVVYRDKAAPDLLMVVDGQQRLTTATLLLAALRNEFDEIEEKALANGTQLLIERADVNAETHFVLRTESSYPYLHEHIQKHGAPALPKSVGKEEEALETAFKYLTRQLKGALKSIEEDPSVPVAKKAEKKKARLLKLRDNVLRLQLIVIELQTEDEAYVIFETLNTRGKDLGIADLVKNLLTRLLKPTNKGVDVARDKWAMVLDTFDESAAEIDVNSFIYHSWISRNSYAGREKLFRRIKAGVTQPKAAGFLADLVEDAKLYRTILEPASGKWSKQEAQIVESLRALVLFKVAQPLPMILAVLRAYRAKDISQAMARDALEVMEKFHVQFTALTAQRTGGGTAKMYAASAQELVNAKSSQKRANALKAFKSKLRARVPSFQEFAAGFGNLEFLSTNTRNKALVQYLLTRLDRHKRTGAPVDYSQMSIEHIAPENPPGNTPSEHGVGAMGNLLLLEESANNKIGNKAFTAKKAIYKSAATPMDPTLTNATAWTKKEINARTTALAKQAYHEVFKL